MEVIFEDNHLIAVNKRPGDISQGDKTGDVPLGETVKAYLKEKYNKPGNVYLGVIHRLDRPVSGVILFAKTGKAASRMSDYLRKREIEKTYWAVVKKRPELPEAKLTHFIVKNEKLNKSFASVKEKPGAKSAVLIYKLIASIENYHLLEVKPETGRHHQIRVQLAFIGCPIKGDLKYGFDRTNPDGSIHLHARHIRFEHPVTHESLLLTAEPPTDAIWNAFREMKIPEL